jgi:hypothetical protein
MSIVGGTPFDRLIARERRGASSSRRARRTVSDGRPQAM